MFRNGKFQEIYVLCKKLKHNSLQRGGGECSSPLVHQIGWWHIITFDFSNLMAAADCQNAWQCLTIKRRRRRSAQFDRRHCRIKLKSSRWHPEQFAWLCCWSTFVQSKPRKSTFSMNYIKWNIIKMAFRAICLTLLLINIWAIQTM